ILSTTTLTRPSPEISVAAERTVESAARSIVPPNWREVKMNSPQDLSRRDFLMLGVAAGGGLLIGIYLPQLRSSEMASDEAFMPNAFVRIGLDGVVTVII